jgi:hypothetical protein
MEKEAIRPPDQRPLSGLQIERLAKVVQLDPAVLKGLSYLDVTDKFKWHFEWPWRNHHKICGRVVKKDPVTGEELPVPFATVHVQDTDSSWISYAPKGSDWLWHYPIRQHRDTIATTRTDECGNFCVWVPWYTIEWIRTWHREIICDPFIRPKIKDYLPPLEFEKPTWPPKFGPGPDPQPDWKKVLGLPSATAENFFGKQLMTRLASGQIPDKLLQKQLTDQIEMRAFSSELKPTLPEEFQMALQHQDLDKGLEAIHAAVGLHTGVDIKQLGKFDPNKVIGPFWRCREVVWAEWQPHFDVPDITFEVLQDTNGDGVEEVIYHEGFFDVRWDAGALPNVKLVASPRAIAIRTCHGPKILCGDQPGILTAGNMPINDLGYVSNDGYAIRPNRPQPASVSSPIGISNGIDAQTPFCYALPIFGCVNIPNAQHYLVEYDTGDGLGFRPFKGLTWPITVVVGGAVTHPTVSPDSAGWYPVLPDVPGTTRIPEHQILAWPTWNYPNGKYVLRVKVATSADKSITTLSDPVTIQVDNSAPTITYSTLAWGEDGVAFPNNLLVPCPMIKRGAVPKKVFVKVEFEVFSDHYRNSGLSSNGCGDGSNFILESLKLINAANGNDPVTAPSGHWHTSVGQHGIKYSAILSLESTASPGAYLISSSATSRSMNPDGLDNSSTDHWFTDNTFPTITAYSEHRIAVVNEN